MYRRCLLKFLIITDMFCQYHCLFPYSRVVSQGDFTYLWKYQPMKSPQMQQKSCMYVYNFIFEANFHIINQNCGNRRNLLVQGILFWKFTQIIHFCGDLSGRASCHFEEISNPLEGFQLFSCLHFLTKIIWTQNCLDRNFQKRTLLLRSCWGIKVSKCQ